MLEPVKARGRAATSQQRLTVGVTPPAIPPATPLEDVLAGGARRTAAAGRVCRVSLAAALRRAVDRLGELIATLDRLEGGEEAAVVSDAMPAIWQPNNHITPSQAARC